MSDLLHLVDRYVEWNSIVVHTPTAEDRGAAGLINRVREAESRLECFLKGVTVIAGGDVTIEIERHQQVAGIPSQRVSPVRVRHVICIQHVGLVIPSNSYIERQLLDRGPVVLQVRSKLLVTRLEERIPGTVLEPERGGKVVCLIAVAGVLSLRIGENRRAVVVLVDVVRREVQAKPTLDYMLASELESRVRNVIAECGAFLDVFLG